MPENFELPVWYNGKEIMLSAEFQPWGYTHRITVYIEDFPFIFEPDEEKNYRAIVSLEDRSKAEKIDPYLLQIIAKTLHDLFA
jgi:hypothetical protein